MKPRQPFYVAVSGNTATGKSTLVRSLRRNPRLRGSNVEFVDEDSIHHRFGSRLFRATKDYGLPLQLNFMVQRYLLAATLLDSGKSLVMERSILDDMVFIRHLKRIRAVTTAEYRAFVALWTGLDQRLRRPDVVVFLSGDPRLSLARLRSAEREGHRTKAYLNEAQRRTWVESWHELYLSSFRQFAKANRGTTMLSASSSEPTRSIANRVVEALADWLNYRATPLKNV